MGGVGDAAGGGTGASAVDVGDGLGAHIQHQGVHQRDVVLVARLVGNLLAQSSKIRVYHTNYLLQNLC